MNTINNLWQTNKSFFVFSGITIFLVILLLIISLLLLFSTPQPTRESQPISPFLETSVGKTNEQSVQQLPGLKRKEKLSDGSTAYFFASVSPLRDSVVVVKNNEVIFEKRITVTPDFQLPKISTYLNTYGSPEMKIKGSKTYGAFETTFIYASKGFALIGNEYTNEVREIQTFKPMSVDEYIKQWGQDIATDKKTTEDINPHYP